MVHVLLILDVLSLPTRDDDIVAFTHVMIDYVGQLLVVIRRVFNAHLEVLLIEGVALKGEGVGEAHGHVGLLVPETVFEQNGLLVLVGI
ncbi:unannotated protein [freshwater metagenome]|uniref:Unannotated protein n=1 Tax=freshwater metagenome TaxID=449393 RepID=A0A6J6X3S0_9ZZZZ